MSHSPKRGAAWALVVAAFSIGGFGCVFLVTPQKGEDHCLLQGGASDCASCLTRHCQDEIDRACFDESVLSVVEQCASRGDDTCDQLPSSPLSTCVKEQCQPVCYRRVGTSKTDCSDSFLAPGLACSCELSSRPNDVACSPSAFPRTRCCAPSGWPGPALSCTCNAVSCVPSSDGCICTLTDNLDAASAEECRGGTHCCASEDRCQCRTRACSAGEREVAVCNKAELACPPLTVEVSSCSIRE